MRMEQADGQLDISRLKDLAKERIRAAIVGGELPAGSVYSASSFARRFGVSVTPVREAMMELVGLRLLEPVRNRGYMVRAISADELNQIIDLRLLLETTPIPAIIQNITNSDIHDAVTRVEAMERAARRGDTVDFLSIDKQFHLALLELAGNFRLVEIVGRLRDETRLGGLYMPGENGELGGPVQEHRKILDAIRSKDIAGTIDLMTIHIEHVRESWLVGNTASVSPIIPSIDRSV